MAATVGMAFVKIMPSAQGFTSALKSEIGDQSAVGTAVGSQVGDGVDSGLQSKRDKIKGRMAELGKMMAVGAGVGLALLGKQAVQAASDLGESLNAVNVTFGESADGIKRLGEEAAQSLGLSQAEFNSLAVQFSNFAQTVAGPGGDVVQVMDDLTTRASDFASVMNLDVAEAATLFQSGLAGETEPLRKYGIDLSVAAVEAHALATGIHSGAGEMTEAQKVQARYSLLMEQTSKTAGDFANTSDSLANRQRIANAEWKNAQAALGQALIPAMETLTGIVQKVVGWFNELSPTTQKWIVYGTLAAAAVAALGYGISIMVTALKAFAVFAKIATAVQWLWNAAMAANPIGLIIIAIAALIAAFVYLYKNNEGFRRGVQAAWEGIKKAVAAVVDWFQRTLVPAFKKAFEAVKGVFAIYVKIWSTIFGAVITAVKAVVSWFQTTLIPAWQKVFGFIGDVIKRYVGIWSTIFNGVKAAIVAVVDGIRRAVEWIVTSIGNVWKKVKELVAKIRGLPGVSAVLRIAGMREGGPITGMGAGDSQVIAAQPGEFMLSRKMVAQAGGTAPLEAWRRGGQMPQTGGGVVIENVNINNPRAERASDSLPSAVRRLAYVGAV